MALVKRFATTQSRVTLIQWLDEDTNKQMCIWIEGPLSTYDQNLENDHGSIPIDNESPGELFDYQVKWNTAAGAFELDGPDEHLETTPESSSDRYCSGSCQPIAKACSPGLVPLCQAFLKCVAPDVKGEE
jgi:hypothetical protein